MKEIVAILSHADTIDKIDILRNCLYEIKKQGYDVILSSHIEIPQDIKNNVDYFVYDKENPLIYVSEFPNRPAINIWQSYPGYYQSYLLEFNHSFAVLKLIKNAIAIANINGYEKLHFVNYDYVLYHDDVLKNHSFHLDSHDLFSYYYDKFETSREHINTGLFSIRVKSYIGLLENIKTKEDFLKSEQAVFEKYFFFLSLKNNLSIKLEDQQILLDTDNILNGKSTFKNVIDDKIYIFLSKETNTNNYYIYANSTKGDIINVDITLGEKKINWKPIPNRVNLLKIPNDILRIGISIFISEFDYHDFYNSETHSADCEISDRNLIQEINWTNYTMIETQTKIKKTYTINEYCDESKPKRWNLINFLAEQYGSINYLEIGVNDGGCIRKINIPNKDGVDPSHSAESGGAFVPEINYQMTSDEFFYSMRQNQSTKKYDIIFIDGLHHSTQVDKDIVNSLEFLNDGGFIILHDCNPPTFEMQIVPRQTGLWNGDVWKSIVKLRCTSKSLDICVVDIDWGVGVIRKGNQQPYDKENIINCLEWEYFHNNREELLNIISIEEFNKKFQRN